MNCRRLLTLVVMLVLGVSGMLAQTTTTGSVNGNITDPTGAAVVGASVVLTNDGTGAKMTAKSGPTGGYHFDLIQPGAYTINVDMAGFSKLESKVQVANSQVLAADLKLTVGSESTTVDVTASGTLLQAENGNVASNISEKVLQEVPNSGNNLAYATKLAPGFNTGFGVVGATQYLVDGLNFNDPYNNATNSGASNLTLGLNNVQESTITSNGYSGQFGGLIGAQASYVSKSGSNRVHGDASWYWSGRALVANSWLHKSVVPIVPRSFENANQWAASISGPVWHDRLFFLADSEGLRAILPASPVTVALPSANLQAYTLSKLTSLGLTHSIPFYQNMFRIYNQAAAAHTLTPGNSSASNTTAFPNAVQTGCPTSSNTLSAADMAGLGLTTAAGVTTGPASACTNSYASNSITYANEALEIFRVDYVARSNEKMYVRVEHDAGVQPTTIDPIDPLFNAISIQPEWNGQFNETHTWGTRVVNNFLLGSSWYGALFGPANLQAQLNEFPAQTSFADSSLSGLGGSISSFPTGRNITSIQLQDDVAITSGLHTIKFGVKSYVTKENDHYFTAGTNPLEAVSTLGAFINGGYDPAFTTTSAGLTNYTKATTFTQTFPLRPNYPVQVSQIAGYIQDDYKATRALTINGTLRLEHQGNIRCLLNCLTQMVTQFPNLTHTSTIPYNQAYLFNQQNVFPGLQALEWEPRLGFAYNPPIMNNTLVVRGGIGIFYDGLASSTLEGVAKNPPVKNSFSVSQDYLANTETKSNLWSDTQAYNVAFAGGITTGGTLASIKASLPTQAEQNAFTPPSAYVPQNNFKMYYVEKWNLEVQKSFGTKTSLSVNYLGNHGVHKPFTNAGLNAYSIGGIQGLPIGPQATTQPDLRFGTVYYYTSGGANNYNGLITTFTQRFKAGSQVQVGYTYGKILDTGANGFSTSTSTGTLDIGAPPDPYHPNRYYGPSTQDEKHNLVITYVYTTQYKLHNEVAQFFAGNWTISGAAFAYSGLPFTVIDTASSSAISSYTTGAYGGSLVAHYIGGNQAKCNYGLDHCLSASQFSSATTVDENQARNTFRGPMYISTDLSVVKQIPVHWEGGVFSVSAQAFNVLNHLNFSRPTGSLSSGSFGKITSTVNPSGLFSGVGGDDSPRILQLKAKIQF